MPEATPYTPGGIDVAAGSALTVQLQPRVFCGRMTGLLFDTDKTFLLPRSLTGIRGLKRFYDQHPGAQVLVVGHTDTRASPAYNLTLSDERARSIAAYLKDDVDSWMEYYPGRTGSAHWGTREDQHMLTALGFYSGPVNGVLDGPTRDAVRAFQTSKGLTADGNPGQNTRRALVTAYMQIDGTTLPAGTILMTHGCGEFHLAVNTADNVDEPRNRRVEVFFFEGRIDPQPLPRCPAPGCTEQPEWVRRTVQTFDLEHAPGALDVTVQDPGGNIVSGASVHASGPSLADGQTDASGIVHFSELIPGAYTVLGSHAGFRDGTAQAQVAEGTSAADGPQTPNSGIVQLQAGVGDLIVNVQDSSGAGITGAQVLVQDSSGATVGNQTTPAGGSVTFPSLASGNYSIAASATGFTGQTINAQVLPSQSNPAQVTLQRATGNLTVHVADNLGAALANASVTVTPASGTAPSPQTTNAQGNVTFNGLEVGSAQIGVTLQGFASGSGSATVQANTTVTANITLTANVANLDVHVTNSGGGNLTGAQVALVGPSGSFSGTTAAGGLARFTALPPGNYTATVTLQDFVQGSGSGQVSINQSNVINVALTPSVGLLEVIVQDNLGAAVPGATVTLTPASLSPPASPNTDAQGHLSFTRVPVGTVNILVRKTGFQDGSAAATVNATSTQTATIILQPSAVDLLVRVVSSAGGNLVGASVNVTGPTSVQGPTDANGSITFHLPVASYQVAASLDNFTAPAPQALTLGTNQTNSITITLTPNAVTAQITGAPLVVVFKKHNCNPARKPITLGVTGTFTGTGTGRFTRSKNTVKFFTAATGGTEITFSGTANVFTANQLTATAPGAATPGVQLFAEGGTVSTRLEDTDLRLELFVGSNPFGTPAAGKGTTVELKVDLFQSRSSRADPAPMGDNPKTDLGRFIHVQDAGFHQGRAMLVVREVRPAGFAGNLELKLVPPPPGGGGPAPGTLQLFTAELHAPGEAVVALARVITPAELSGAPVVAGSKGLALFAEGQNPSNGRRDVQLQLKIQADADPADGDRVAFTVVRFTNLQATVPSTRSPRTGAIPDHPPFTISGASANHFSEDFALNPPLVLLQNSIVAATPVRLTVTVQPAGVPVSWSALRDTRPAQPAVAAHANDGDAPAVVALSPNARPTVATTGATTATLLTDAVGSFRVRAYVNNNSTADFDRDPATADSFSPDPFLLLNLVLVHVRLDHDDVQSHQTLVGAAQGGGGIRGSSGVFNLAGAPNNTALHHNALCTIIGGGRNGRLGTDRVFGGWLQDAVAAIGFRGTYVDNTVAPPAVHPLPTVQENPRRGAAPPTTTPDILPSPPPPAPPVPPPAIFPTPPPILDSGRGNAGQGGLTGCLGQSTITSRNNAALGEQLRIQAVDSPAKSYVARHPGFPAARLTFFHFGMNFRANLAFWTNNATPPNGNRSGDPADRLYVVALEVPWTMVGEWDINPVSGAVAVHGAAPAVTMPGNVTHTPAVAAQGLNVEPTVAAGQTTWLGTWIHDAQH